MQKVAKNSNSLSNIDKHSVLFVGHRQAVKIRSDSANAHIKGIKEYFKLQIIVYLVNDKHGEVISYC